MGFAGCNWKLSPFKEDERQRISRPSCGQSKRDAQQRKEIVTDGKTSHVISLPSDGSRTLEIASGELQTYIKRSTGAGLPIRISSEQSKRLELKVDSSISPCDGKRGLEAFTIHRDEQSFKIVGATSRAVLYAVYDILEHEVGVRWAAPGHSGEYVPNIESVAIAPFEGISSPDFGYRVAGNFHSEEYVIWAIRNRLHIPRWPMEDDWSGVHDRPRKIVTDRDSYITDPTTHSFAELLPRSKFEKEHPEWYSENQININNEEVRDAVINQVRSFFDSHPDAEMCPLTPNDGYGWPETTTSRSDLEAQSAAGHPVRINHHETVSEAYFRFVVEIAEQLKETHPDKKLYVYAYTNYVYPPVKLKELPDNVIVSVAHYTPADYAHPIGSNSTSESQEFASILEKWVTMAHEHWMYSYTVKYALDALPQPIAYRLGEDIEFLYRLGYTGFYSQGAEDRWGQMGPHFYIMAKKLWDHTRSVDDILTEYFEVMAGEGAEEARIAYDTLAKSMEGMPDKVNRHPLREARSYLSTDVIKDADRNLRDAFKSASGQRTQENVRAMRLPIKYSRHYFQMRESIQAYEKDGHTDSLREAVTAWNEIRDLFVENQDLDSLPLSLISPDGYFTLQRHFQPHLEKIDREGENWSVDVI